MKLIYAQEKIEIEGKSVFLAGPTPRSKDVESWRPVALKMFNQSKFNGTIMLPEMRHGWDQEYAYKSQIEWELEAMEKADMVLFWIPRHLETMPAFTTNTEFGIWIAKDPSKIRIGIPNSAVKCDYIKYLCLINDIKVHTYLNNLVESIVK